MAARTFRSRIVWTGWAFSVGGASGRSGSRGGSATPFASPGDLFFAIAHPLTLVVPGADPSEQPRGVRPAGSFHLTSVGLLPAAHAFVACESMPARWVPCGQAEVQFGQIN